MKSAIVTGANGFVGYWLTKELSDNGCNVIAIVRDSSSDVSKLKSLNGVTIVYCPLSNLKNLPDKINKKGYDAFYHLAWTGAGGDTRADYDIQIRNAQYCCDAVYAAAHLECSSILLSGTVTENLVKNVLHKSMVAKNEIYGVCKQFAHYLSYIESQRFNIRHIWMQFANLFGPGSINGNIVGYTIEQILKGENACFGPANQYYDLLYVTDLAHAAYLLGKSSKTQGCYYIGSGTPRKLQSYLLEIGEVLGKPHLIKIGERQDDGTRYDESWFDISALKNETGYTPITTFEKGIIHTKEWMKNKQ
ncbi:MAG: NAD(P)-dependent oxidoreductase [Muribaculaceae bacterium]|nr:NAD(P)-dependent oxidoreductase [Muribaculaceae bacterium]